MGLSRRLHSHPFPALSEALSQALGGPDGLLCKTRGQMSLAQRAGPPQTRAPFGFRPEPLPLWGSCAAMDVALRHDAVTPYARVRAPVCATHPAFRVRCTTHGMAAWCPMPCAYLRGIVPGCLRCECTRLTVWAVWVCACVGMGRPVTNIPPHARRCRVRATVTGFDFPLLGREQARDGAVHRRRDGCLGPGDHRHGFRVDSAEGHRGWYAKLPGTRCVRRRRRPGYRTPGTGRIGSPRNGRARSGSALSAALWSSPYLTFRFAYLATSPRAPARCGADPPARAGV